MVGSGYGLGVVAHIIGTNATLGVTHVKSKDFAARNLYTGVISCRMQYESARTAWRKGKTVEYLGYSFNFPPKSSRFFFSRNGFFFR